MTLLLRVLHVGIAAAWFGHKLLIPADLSSSLHSTDKAAALIPRMDRAELLGQVSGIGTLITGLGLLWAVGPSTVAVTVYAGLGLVLVAIAAGAVVARRASIALRAGVEAGDLEAARNNARRLSGVPGTRKPAVDGCALVMMLV